MTVDMQKLSKEEETRAEYLLKLKLHYEKVLEKIQRELTPLIYKLDRKI